MRKRSTFTIDAESVQGNPGATVTFRSLLVREVNEINAGDAKDADVVKAHVTAWSGFVDDEDRELPSPADDPEVLGALNIYEQAEIIRLLFAGPDGEPAKN